MLLYGGIGLLLAGLIMTFFGGAIIKDAEKAAKAKKNAPAAMVVGVIMLGAWAYFSGMFA